MSGIKLQIIDNSDCLYKAVVRLIPDTFEIDFSADGHNAATRICNYHPDILMLSASLPGGDGFHILQTVQSTGLHPMVLMITPLISDYAVEQAALLKIDYMMCKPCDVQKVAAHLMNFREKLMGVKGSAQACARKFLMDLNVRTNLRGYDYLVTALTLLLRNPDWSLSKELYPAVAKIHKGSWQQIERGIRLVIKDAWENREGEGWQLYFAHQKDKPSNSAFLACGLQCLQELGLEEA